MENTSRSRKVVKISRKKLIILIIILILGTILYNKYNNHYRYVYDVAMPEIANSVLPSKGGSTPTYGFPVGEYMPSTMPYYPDQYGQKPSVEDTREFMKVAYGGQMSARNVKSKMKEVKSAISTADGRIDNLSETSKYSSVSFVIPKTNLNDFRDEIESITHEKLFLENYSSQNLLTQKQSIEEQQKNSADSLAQLQSKQKSLTAEHTKKISDWQKELANYLSETKRLNETPNPQVTTNLEAQIYNENLDYATSLQNIKNQIADINKKITDIGKQDVEFTENVETVTGYISVNWISLWDMAKLFSPIHPIFVILILAGIVWYFLNRKNYIPAIEFV